MVLRLSMFLPSFSYPTCGRRWSFAWAEPKKTTEKRNKLRLLCDVINDVSLINRTSSESPWSEVSGLRQTKCGNHVVALWSKMNKNLKNTLERHLVDQFWWHIPQKIGILLLTSNPYTWPVYMTCISWPIKGHQRSKLGQIGRINRNVFNIHLFRLRYLDFWLVRALEGVETSRFMYISYYIRPRVASK